LLERLEEGLSEETGRKKSDEGVNPFDVNPSSGEGDL
jgi:hypothetical protein